MPFYSLEHDGNRLRVRAPDLPALKTKVDTMALPAGLHAPCALTCTQIDAQDDLRRDWIHVDDLAEANLRVLGFMDLRYRPDCWVPAETTVSADPLRYSADTAFVESFRGSLERSAEAMRVLAARVPHYVEWMQESAVAQAQGVGISAPKPPPLSYDFSGEDLEMSPEEIRAWKAKNQK